MKLLLLFALLLLLLIFDAVFNDHSPDWDGEDRMPDPDDYRREGIL